MIDRSIISIEQSGGARDRVTLRRNEGGLRLRGLLLDIGVVVRSGYFCGAWCTLLIKEEEEEEEEKSRTLSQDPQHPGRTARRRRGENSR